MRNLIFILIILFGVLSAFAEAELGFEGGAAYPSKEAFRTGYFGGIYAGGITENSFIGGDFNYQSAPASDRVNTVFGKISHPSEVNAFSAGFKYRYLPDTKFIFQPFLGLGLGFSRMWENHKVLNDYKELSDGSNLFIKPSVGIYYFISDSISLTAELRYDHYFFNFDKQDYSNSGLTGIIPENNPDNPGYVTFVFGLALRI